MHFRRLSCQTLAITGEHPRMSIARTKYNCAVCTSCATLNEGGLEGAHACTKCGAHLDSPSSSALYRYAEATIYYGYQYRSLFERQKGEPNPPKFSLSFIGEAFTFVALAAISGVIGNLAYDIIKSAMVRIRDQAREVEVEGRGYEALAALTDDDLDLIYEYSKSYVQAFEDLERTIREDIQEEIMADAVGDAVAQNPELLNILAIRECSEEDTSAFVEAITAAMKKQPYTQKPSASAFKNFWARLHE